MNYFKLLLNTRAPKGARLLDIALILSIIPHLFVAKIFMLLYLAIATFFIYKRFTNSTLLMLIGLMLIGLSFFSSYNFSDFSRMQFFISLVSSLLILAVTLQKLTNTVNIYLKISPILLMILSFFFYDSIMMLLYSIATLYIFTLIYIWSRMDTTLLEVAKFTSRLFLLSLPLVTLLFLLFPRISIEKSEFGFRADSYTQSAYDGTMRVSLDSIRLSKKIVMEILFSDANISNNQLYFRGSTLNEQKGLEWIKSSTPKREDSLSERSHIKEYELTIYPHAQQWLYSLDMPINTPKRTLRESDYTLRSIKPLYEKKKYLLKSALHYKLTTESTEQMLTLDSTKAQRSFDALKEIRESKLTKKQKAYALLDFFRSLNLAYTLSPKGVDLDNFCDSFLFESKNGYCVHFASAFATTARMLDIPSRVVTGFKGDKSSMINNYLLIRASDAHAWVELYFDREGWVRFDPTTTATRELLSLETQQRATLFSSPLFTKANHYFLYTKYLLNNWILHYNRVKQMEILKELLSNTLSLLKFIAIFSILLFLSLALVFLLKSTPSQDRALQEMQTLLKFLKKRALKKEPHESMQAFLRRAQSELEIELEPINKLYERLKYTKEPDRETLKELKEEIDRVRKKERRA